MCTYIACALLHVARHLSSCCHICAKQQKRNGEWNKRTEQNRQTLINAFGVTQRANVFQIQNRKKNIRDYYVFCSVYLMSWLLHRAPSDAYSFRCGVSMLITNFVCGQPKLSIHGFDSVNGIGQSVSSLFAIGCHARSHTRLPDDIDAAID